jgi:pimeloyl-ACP methyl ester carboxylesterase
VRRVVLSAKRQGKRVILGGHSLGASLTVAYASWDFAGHPGYEDLGGLVLIDGGLLGSFLTGGRVLRGARRLTAGSKVPRARSVLVDASSDESHLDPLTAAPARNEFLQTVVPFLRKLRRSAP